VIVDDALTDIRRVQCEDGLRARLLRATIPAYGPGKRFAHQTSRRRCPRGFWSYAKEGIAVLSSALNRDRVIEPVQWANSPPKYADGAARSLHFRNRSGSSDNRLSLLGYNQLSRRHRRDHRRIEIGSCLCQPSSRRRTVHRIFRGSRRAPMSPASRGCSQREPNPTKALPSTYVPCVGAPIRWAGGDRHWAGMERDGRQGRIEDQPLFIAVPRR
jgi:hypothetical protein